MKTTLWQYNWSGGGTAPFKLMLMGKRAFNSGWMSGYAMTMMMMMMIAIHVLTLLVIMCCKI